MSVLLSMQGTPGPARQPGAEELAKLLAAARQECEELRQQLEKQKALSGAHGCPAVQVHASARGRSRQRRITSTGCTIHPATTALMAAYQY